MSVTAALALQRFAFDAAALSLWGAFGFLAALVPGDLARRLEARFRLFRLLAVGTAVAAAVAALPIETAAVGAGWPDAHDPGMLAAVLFQTGVGTACMLQAAAAALLLGAAFAPPARLRIPAVAVAAGLATATLATTGHAVMDEGVRGLLHRGIDTLHALSAGAWVGALLPLLPILRALDDHRLRGQAAIALRRFSSVGHAVVAVVIATGVLNTVLILGRWPTDWSSPYQALLSLKILLVAVMVAVALVNRYRFVPRLRQDPAASRRAIGRGTLLNIVLGLAAILCVSVFGLLEPTAPPPSLAARQLAPQLPSAAPLHRSTRGGPPGRQAAGATSVVSLADALSTLPS